MAILTQSEIQTYVKNILDESQLNTESGFLGTADNGLKNIINAVAPNAVRKIVLQSPNTLLNSQIVIQEDTDTFEDLGFGNTRCKAVIPLTTNISNKTLLRMVYAKVFMIDDYDRIISSSNTNVLLGEESKEYKEQRNEYYVGSEESPKAFLVRKIDGEGKEYDAIELYSFKDDYNSEIYVGIILEPEFVVPTGGTQATDIFVCDRLKQPTLNQIVADTLKSINENQKAQIYERMAVDYLNTYSDLQRQYNGIGERITQ